MKKYFSISIFMLLVTFTCSFGQNLLTSNKPQKSLNSSQKAHSKPSATHSDLLSTTVGFNALKTVRTVSKPLVGATTSNVARGKIGQDLLFTSNHLPNKSEVFANIKPIRFNPNQYSAEFQLKSLKAFIAAKTPANTVIASAENNLPTTSINVLKNGLIEAHGSPVFVCPNLSPVTYGSLERNRLASKISVNTYETLAVKICQQAKASSKFFKGRNLIIAGVILGTVYLYEEYEKYNEKGVKTNRLIY